MYKLLLLVLAIPLLVIPAAYAIDFDICAATESHHCTEFAPQQNEIPADETANVHVEIHLPDNNAQVLYRTLSPDNFTALQNNVAVMYVGNIHTTSEKPDNYCPIARYTLQYQGIPEYLNKFYDPTKSLDITRYVYPTYCYPETGENPINHDIPEFPASMIILYLTLASVAGLGIYLRKRHHL